MLDGLAQASEADRNFMLESMQLSTLLFKHMATILKALRHYDTRETRKARKEIAAVWTRNYQHHMERESGQTTSRRAENQ